LPAPITRPGYLGISKPLATGCRRIQNPENPVSGWI
jgi:hypothetical protein